MRSKFDLICGGKIWSYDVLWFNIVNPRFIAPRICFFLGGLPCADTPRKKPVYCWVDIAIAEIIHSSGWGGNRRSWSSPFANLPVRQLLCIYIYVYQVHTERMDEAWSGCKAFIPKQLGSHVSCDWICMQETDCATSIGRRCATSAVFLSFETTRFATTYDNICTAPHPETKKNRNLPNLGLTHTQNLRRLGVDRCRFSQARFSSLQMTSTVAMKRTNMKRNDVQ